jgi:hypothetical protein
MYFVQRLYFCPTPQWHDWRLTYVRNHAQFTNMSRLARPSHRLKAHEMAPRLITWFVLTALLAACVAQHDHAISGPAIQGNAKHEMPMNSTPPALPIPDSCVTDPTQTNCTSFKYPHKNAVADLNALCTAMSFMAACSVKAKCAEVGAGPDNVTSPTATQVSSADSHICRILHQVATVCRHDSGMSKMKGEASLLHSLLAFSLC